MKFRISLLIDAGPDMDSSSLVQILTRLHCAELLSPTLTTRSVPAHVRMIFCEFDCRRVFQSIEISYDGCRNDVEAIAQKLAQIVEAFCPCFVYWHYAETVSNSSYFLQGMREFLEGGVYPVLNAVGYITDDPDFIISKGLQEMGGQEVRLWLNGRTKREGIAVMVRLANSIILEGPINQEYAGPGLKMGDYLYATPNLELNQLEAFLMDDEGPTTLN
jgi:hypothetical protein